VEEAGKTGTLPSVRNQTQNASCSKPNQSSSSAAVEPNPTQQPTLCGGTSFT
jgi:hypothetical protein